MSEMPFLERLVDLFKEDQQLHDALVNLITAKANAEYQLAKYREAKGLQIRRKKEEMKNERSA